MKISHQSLQDGLEERFSSPTWIPGCSQKRGMDPRICMKDETWSSRKITCSRQKDSLTEYVHKTHTGKKTHTHNNSVKWCSVMICVRVGNYFTTTAPQCLRLLCQKRFKTTPIPLQTGKILLKFYQGFSLDVLYYYFLTKNLPVLVCLDTSSQPTHGNLNKCSTTGLSTMSRLENSNKGGIQSETLFGRTC